MCFHVPIYIAGMHMFYVMGINWQLLTHLAALDALLVIKKKQICVRLSPPPPQPTPIELAPSL